MSAGERTSDLSPTVVISISDARWQELLPDLAAMTKTAISETLRVAKFSAGDVSPVEIGVTYADNAEVQVLNLAWRKKDKPTNVLSFPAANSKNLPPGAPHLLGDIVLAFETVVAEADQAGKSLVNHTSHLLIHGCLHLLGYDHEADIQANTMESLEIKILSGFHITDPYILPHET